MDKLGTKIWLLGLYITGIIIGGGILALPFVARDTGLPLLIFLLVFFGILFHIIYIRMLDSVSGSIQKLAKIKEGQALFDFAIIDSGLGVYGKLAFTVGLVLYVLPADIVYILYGMKSIIELGGLLGSIIDEILFIVGIVGILLVFIGTIMYVRSKKKVLMPHESFMIKFFAMFFLWMLGIGVLSFFSGREIIIVLAVLMFALSLIIGEFVPEKMFGVHYDEIVNEDLLPRHKTSAVLTLVKVILVITIPLIAAIMIFGSLGMPSGIAVMPLSPSAVVYSITIIIFMYAGSGIYNILVYRWVTRKIENGKKAVLIGTLLSMMTYIVFTVIIIFSVSPQILLYSDLNREHAFIALSRQLSQIGMGLLSYTAIIVANIFALISVSIAYMGFTDTLSERLNLEYNINFDAIWLILTIVISISTALLEIFNVARFATDVLGVAGNAGGGLFIMVLPWLLKDKNGKKHYGLATLFLAFITTLNIFLAVESATIIASVTAIIATLIVAIIGVITIYKAKK